MSSRDGEAYHTAIGSNRLKVEGAAPVARWRGCNSVALVHDAGDPFPKEFRTCDVLYAEPAWRPGYQAFHDLAGITPKLPWPDWVQAYERHALALRVPFALPCGKDSLRYLSPDSVQMLRLRGTDSRLALYGIKSVAAADDVGVIEELAQRFKRVGDFACGYGRTGKIFMKHGGTFVMSDISAECIGYIAMHAKAWRRKVS